MSYWRQVFRPQPGDPAKGNDQLTRFADGERLTAAQLRDAVAAFDLLAEPRLVGKNGLDEWRQMPARDRAGGGRVRRLAYARAEARALEPGHIGHGDVLPEQEAEAGG